MNEYVIESFIDRCDELMIANEGLKQLGPNGSRFKNGLIKIYNFFVKLAHRIREKILEFKSKRLKKVEDDSGKYIISVLIVKKDSVVLSKINKLEKELESKYPAGGKPIFDNEKSDDDKISELDTLVNQITPLNEIRPDKVKIDDMIVVCDPSTIYTRLIDISNKIDKTMNELNSLISDKKCDNETITHYNTLLKVYSVRYKYLSKLTGNIYKCKKDR